jgi:hypothetical protein
MMNCKRVHHLLDDYLDSALRREDEAGIRRHLADCRDCRQMERALRSLLERAATLPTSIDPPRDLWLGIDRRLDRRDKRWPARPLLRRVTRRSGLTLLAASIILVALAVGYLLRGMERPPARTSIATVQQQNPPETRFAVDASELARAERAIVQAEIQLRDLLDERRNSLSAGTVRTVEHNLAVIDIAIDEIRAALAHDPNNRELGRRLLSVRQRRLDLLQRATHLAARAAGAETI